MAKEYDDEMKEAVERDESLDFDDEKNDKSDEKQNERLQEFDQPDRKFRD